jgi:hypothetical protein
MRYALVETVMKKVFEGSAGVKLNGSAPSRRSINWRGTGLGAHRYQYLMRVMSAGRRRLGNFHRVAPQRESV